MRTIKPISEEEIRALRKEPWDMALLVLQDPPVKLPRRIALRLEEDLSCGCWRASGWGTGKGHAKISVLGNHRQLHRVVYTLLKGLIPDGKILDHVKEKGCKHRDCCNPDHLEPVTVKENTERGEAVLYGS